MPATCWGCVAREVDVHLLRLLPMEACGWRELLENTRLSQPMPLADDARELPVLDAAAFCQVEDLSDEEASSASEMTRSSRVMQALRNLWARHRAGTNAGTYHFWTGIFCSRLQLALGARYAGLANYLCHFSHDARAL